MRWKWRHLYTSCELDSDLNTTEEMIVERDWARKRSAKLYPSFESNWDSSHIRFVIKLLLIMVAAHNVYDPTSALIWAIRLNGPRNIFCPKSCSCKVHEYAHMR